METETFYFAHAAMSEFNTAHADQWCRLADMHGGQIGVAEQALFVGEKLAAAITEEAGEDYMPAYEIAEPFGKLWARVQIAEANNMNLELAEQTVGRSLAAAYPKMKREDLAALAAVIGVRLAPDGNP